MRTREQEYAAIVFRQVSDNIAPQNKAKYGTMAHKLPVLVRTAGLAQALAFVAASSEAARGQLLDHLAYVTMQTDRDTLLKRSRGDAPGWDRLSQYMLLTQQVLDALVWYKRFAETVLDIRGTDEAAEVVEGAGGTTHNTGDLPAQQPPPAQAPEATR